MPKLPAFLSVLEIQAEALSLQTLTNEPFYLPRPGSTHPPARSCCSISSRGSFSLGYCSAAQNFQV